MPLIREMTLKKICMDVTLDSISDRHDVFGVKASYYNELNVSLKQTLRSLTNWVTFILVSKHQMEEFRLILFLFSTWWNSESTKGLPRWEIMKGPQWQGNKNWCCHLRNMYCYIPCGHEGKKQRRVALWRMLQVRFSSRTDYAMIALSDIYEKKERGHRHWKSAPSAQSIHRGYGIKDLSVCPRCQAKVYFHPCSKPQTHSGAEVCL